MSAEETARQNIVETCLKLNASGINQGTSGNVSERFEDGLLISPTSMPYDQMRPQDVVFIDAQAVAHGTRAPSSEWRFHFDILAQRKDAHAVIHAHPHYCTTLAILGKPIPALHYMIFVGGGMDIRCAPYALFGTNELSKHALDALLDRKACLLEHHGMIALGEDLAQTLWRAVEVETLARQYHACLSLGQEPNLLSPAQMDEVFAKVAGYGL